MAISSLDEQGFLVWKKLRCTGLVSRALDWEIEVGCVPDCAIDLLRDSHDIQYKYTRQRRVEENRGTEKGSKFSVSHYVYTVPTTVGTLS